MKRAILTGVGPFKNRYVRLAVAQELPLFVRGLLVEAVDGSRVCLIGADLHGGSRWLTERIAQLTCHYGFHPGNIFLSATHNHAGPGGLYGSAYFDGFAAATSLFRAVTGEGRLAFNLELAEWVADRVATAIRQAHWEAAFVAPGVGRALVPLAINRSLVAFLRNFDPQHAEAEALDQLSQRFPIEVAGGSLARAAVDPRVSAVVAFTDAPPGEARIIGAFATYGAHNFVLDRKHDIQSPDYFGHAQAIAETVIAAKQGSPAVVALVAGSIGDSDPLPPEYQRLDDFAAKRTESHRNEALSMVRQHGELVAVPLLASIEAARAVGPHELETISAGLIEEPIAGADVGSGKVAALPCVGRPTLAGSELGPSGAPLVKEGDLSAAPFLSAPGHWPKATFFPLLAFPNAALSRQIESLPVRLLRFRFQRCPALNLVGLPGEPTLWTALTLAEHARRDQGECSFVAGVTGEYSGYLTTQREYGAQQYEGSSTIWGPLTHEWLLRQVRKLKTGEHDRPPTGSARFTGELEDWHSNLCVVDGKPIGFWSPNRLSREEVLAEHEPERKLEP